MDFQSVFQTAKLRTRVSVCSLQMLVSDQRTYLSLSLPFPNGKTCARHSQTHRQPVQAGRNVILTNKPTTTVVTCGWLAQSTGGIQASNEIYKIGFGIFQLIWHSILMGKAKKAFHLEHNYLFIYQPLFWFMKYWSSKRKSYKHHKKYDLVNTILSL